MAAILTHFHFKNIPTICHHSEVTWVSPVDTWDISLGDVNNYNKMLSKCSQFGNCDFSKPNIVFSSIIRYKFMISNNLPIICSHVQKRWLNVTNMGILSLWPLQTIISLCTTSLQIYDAWNRLAGISKINR